MYNLLTLVTYTSDEKRISVRRSDIDIFVAFHTVNKFYNMKEEIFLCWKLSSISAHNIFWTKKKKLVFTM